MLWQVSLEVDAVNGWLKPYLSTYWFTFLFRGHSQKPFDR